MHAVDAETLARFRRRFAAVDAEIPAAPSFVRPRPTVVARGGLPVVAAAFAVVLGVGAFLVLGPLLDRTVDPLASPSTSSTVATPGPGPTDGASPVSVNTPLPLVSPIPFGDWLLSCPDIAEADCTGVAERFVELMARDAAYVRGLTDGVLSVVTRPICPAVPEGADGSTCWEVTAPEGWPLGGDWCMVFARPTDQGEPPFVHVGGPTGTDSPEPAPSVWPTCAEPAVGEPLVTCGRIGTVACDSAIAMVAAFDAAAMVGATWIRMDDTCPEPAVCDRRWPFDVVVVVGTGPERQQPWSAFHVYGERGPEGIERWVTPLPAHMGIASVPIRLSDDAVKRVVNDYGNDHASDWGGMYIDQDRGGIIVALFSDDLERHRTTLTALAGPHARLEIRGVEFSYAELKGLSESLCQEAAWFATIPAVLQGCGGVDQSENRIIVGVSTANPDAVRMIEEHFDLAGKIIVEVDGTGAALLPRGTLRITAVDASGRPVEGLQCSPVPDIGTGPEGLGPLTDADGVCVVDLPATGAWVYLVADPGPGERTVAIERVVVQPDRTTDVQIVVR